MKPIVDFIFVVGFVVNILIILMLLGVQKKGLSKYLLIVIYAFCLCYILRLYAYFHIITYLFAFCLFPTKVFGFLLGPLVLLYVKSLFLKEDKLIIKNSLHFIPYVLFTIAYSIPFAISRINEEFASEYLTFIKDNYTFFIVAIHVHLIFYLVLSLQVISEFTKVMKYNFSELESKGVKWIKKMIVTLFWLIGIFAIVDFNFIYKFIAVKEFFFLTPIAFIIAIVYSAYHGTKQSKVLLPVFLLNEVGTIASNKKPTAHHLSNASNKELQVLQQQLKSVLESEKPYLDQDITLDGLAKLIPTANMKLSALLNHVMGTTFYDLINKYRVVAVIEKMNSNDCNKYTLLGIAYECGFNSKASFNRFFKSETGYSPSAYKKQMHNFVSKQILHS